MLSVFSIVTIFCEIIIFSYQFPNTFWLHSRISEVSIAGPNPSHWPFANSGRIFYWHEKLHLSLARLLALLNLETDALRLIINVNNNLDSRRNYFSHLTMQILNMTNPFNYW